jgi:hypothetical protein
MVACAYCRTQIDVSKPDIQIIKKYNATVQQFDLPLGARAPLRGTTYEVIGAMVRAGDSGPWTEYLLFNPRAGFRWLIDDQGHWSLAQTIKDVSAIKPGFPGLTYADRAYRKFSEGHADVSVVVGEFYWRVKVGDRVTTADYVAPPFMLSQERSATETIWSVLEYIPPMEIAAAFKISDPEPDGIAPHQPNPATATLASIKRTIWASLCLAVVVQSITAFAARERWIALGDYVPAASRGREMVFGPIHLEARRSLNELVASGPLSNGWVDLDYALVDKTSGASYEFSAGFEFYRGIDGDGPWSEGSTRSRALVTSLPRGDKDVVVDSSSGDARGSPVTTPLRLWLFHDSVPWRNFWLVCAVILGYPFYLLVRRASFERDRWSESAFNPYGTRR